MTVKEHNRKIVLRLPEKLLEDVDKAAKDLGGLSRSHLVRLVLKEFLAMANPDEPYEAVAFIEPPGESVVVTTLSDEDYFSYLPE
jgi:metal-responsive CopG/Arc/MetJ family transcriptional regulator